MTPAARGSQSVPAPLTVDVHAHVLPAGVAMPEDAPAWPPGLADPALRLADMDATGVDIQALSPWMELHPSPASVDEARERLQKVNEALVATVATAPARFLALPLVSREHPELAVEELRRLSPVRGVVGAALPLGGPGVPLHHPDWEPFWQACDDTAALVLLHPWRAGSAGGPNLGEVAGLGDAVDSPAQSASVVAGLVLEGVLCRHPDLRLCLVHGGGVLPWLLGRLDAIARLRPDWQDAAQPPSAYVRRLWFDSLTHSGDALVHLARQVDPSHVLLGTDYPFATGDPDGVARLRSALDPDTAERILRHNPRRALLRASSS
jgi:aminocarboxymuconate-semialdehyde decarboxylase